MFTSKTTKTELQAAVERLEKEVEQYKAANESLRADCRIYNGEIEAKDKQIKILNEAVFGTKAERDKAQKDAREYKQEIDSLADTKTVLDRLMSILRSPHNDYQKVVDELNNMIRQERSRADSLEQQLRDIQFDIQHNKFLDGKVQAYETVLHTTNRAAPFCQTNQEEVI